MALPSDDSRLGYVQGRSEPLFTILTVASGSELYQRLKNAFDSNSPFLHNGRSFWVMSMRQYDERGKVIIDCDLVRIVPKTPCSADKVMSAPQPPPVDSATFKQMVKDVYDQIRDASVSSSSPPLTPAQQAAQRAMMQPQQKRTGLLGLDSAHD